MCSWPTCRFSIVYRLCGGKTAGTKFELDPIPFLSISGSFPLHSILYSSEIFIRTFYGPFITVQHLGDMVGFHLSLIYFLVFLVHCISHLHMCLCLSGFFGQSVSLFFFPLFPSPFPFLPPFLVLLHLSLFLFPYFLLFLLSPFLTIFKVFIEFVMILLLFYVLFSFFLAMKHVGSQVPDQGLDFHTPALEGEVLTTGPPGKSHLFLFLFSFSHFPPVFCFPLCFTFVSSCISELACLSPLSAVRFFLQTLCVCLCTKWEAAKAS